MARLTLTFDNGPWPEATARILDILADRGLAATFFVVGEQLADTEGRRVAERAKAEGHWIGNHTMTHGTPLGLRRDPHHPEHEIGAAQRALGRLAHPDRLFRPNGKGVLGPHLLSRAAADYLSAHRYTVVTWNNVPRDWEEPKECWIDRALDGMEGQDWTLIVLHDHHLAGMIHTLPDFLDRVTAQGIEIVQDFPDSCVPIRRGQIQYPLDALVAVSPRDV
jgi:peptidoglycan/xylan/chitin deacetylase (PgdA/CDA1 family)